MLQRMAFEMYEFRISMELGKDTEVTPLDWIFQYDLERDVPRKRFQKSKGYTDKEIRE